MSNPVRKKQLAFNRLQDQMVIIDFNSTRQFHQVNELGARIWELCDSHHSVDQIVETLLEEYDVEKAVLEKDVVEFLEELKRNDLLDY